MIDRGTLASYTWVSQFAKKQRFQRGKRGFSGH